MTDIKALIAEARKWEGMEWPDPIDEETLKCAQDVADSLIRRLADALERAEGAVCQHGHTTGSFMKNGVWVKECHDYGATIMAKP